MAVPTFKKQVAQTDWVDGAAGVFTLSVPATEHTKGNKPMPYFVQSKGGQATPTAPFVESMVTIEIQDNGDLTLTVVDKVSGVLVVA